MQNGLGPATAGSQYVTVRKATTGSQAHKRLQRHALRQQIGHVYVHHAEARLSEGPCHLDMAVHALFTQNGHTWLRCQGPLHGIRIRPLGRVGGRKRQFVRQSCAFAALANQRILLLGRLWIVSQRLHVERRRSPRLLGVGASRRIHCLTMAADVNVFIFQTHVTNDAYGLTRHTETCEHRRHSRHVSAAHLQDGTQLLIKEGRDRRGTHNLGNVQIDTHTSRKCHLQHRRQQATIRTIMVCMHKRSCLRHVGMQLLEHGHGMEEGLEHVRILHIRRLRSHLTEHLRQRGATQTLMAICQVNQH